jgi:hypothetical protein
MEHKPLIDVAVGDFNLIIGSMSILPGFVFAYGRIWGSWLVRL